MISYGYRSFTIFLPLLRKKVDNVSKSHKQWGMGQESRDGWSGEEKEEAIRGRGSQPIINILTYCLFKGEHYIRGPCGSFANGQADTLITHLLDRLTNFYVLRAI